MDQKKTIVMIGSSCIDEYYEMNHVPDLGDKAVLKFLENKVGGMIANAAAVAASYGMNTYLMDTMSGSDYTKMLEDDLVQSRIHLDMIRHDPKLPDTKCMIFLKDGERIVWVLPSAKKDVVPDEGQKEIFQTAEYVYSSIEELRRFRDTKGFMQWLHAVNTKIVIDVEWINDKDWEPAWEIIQNADIIFVNDEGCEQLKKLVSEDYTKQLTRYGGLVVETKGAKGCVIYTPEGEVYQIPAYKVEPIDTTGAGDTFNASFVYGLSQGWDVQKAGKFANAAAGRAILGLGARSGVVGEAAVMNFINERSKEK